MFKPICYLLCDGNKTMRERKWGTNLKAENNKRGMRNYSTEEEIAALRIIWNYSKDYFYFLASALFHPLKVHFLTPTTKWEIFFPVFFL